MAPETRPSGIRTRNPRVTYPTSCWENGGRALDWRETARLALTSRAMDRLEERVLYPEKLIPYQFSAAGHELPQVLLGQMLDGERDAVSAYYRCRPVLLGVGLSPVRIFGAPLGKLDSPSEGRDLGGTWCHAPGDGVTVLPMAGGVGTQFTPACGWAHALRHLHGDDRSIAVALGGDGAVASNGFWSALNMATTLRLPVYFHIENNGYAISVPTELQTPGGNIAANLAAFRGLHVEDVDGTDPRAVSEALERILRRVRTGRGPALGHFRVPRLSGHSGQDTQAYKPASLRERELANDPLDALRRHVVGTVCSDEEWEAIRRRVDDETEAAMHQAVAGPDPDPSQVTHHLFAPPETRETPVAAAGAGSARINMGEAIKQTLRAELRRDPRIAVFGEDVGRKGGVHLVTAGLQEEFGEDRVFDTALSEEGIIGRSLGMAVAGMRPVPELQFRKYAEPAHEQLNNCGTVRWRTAGQFSVPTVVRIAVGTARVGDPWHSATGEAELAKMIGWRVAVPSRAADAVGLLRTALRGDDPTFFLEHRKLLGLRESRGAYPGDEHHVPFGEARIVCHGSRLTIVTWGATVYDCVEAARSSGVSCEIIDLRTLVPWDVELVMGSVRRTSRLLIVHEDTLTCGFGAEIAAVAAEEAFFHLDAPVRRIATEDIPTPYHVELARAVMPTTRRIRHGIEELVAL